MLAEGSTMQGANEIDVCQAYAVTSEEADLLVVLLPAGLEDELDASDLGKWMGKVADEAKEAKDADAWDAEDEASMKALLAKPAHVLFVRQQDDGFHAHAFRDGAAAKVSEEDLTLFGHVLCAADMVQSGDGFAVQGEGGASLRGNASAARGASLTPTKVRT